MNDEERVEVAFAARMNEAAALLKYANQRFAQAAEVLISINVRPDNYWLDGTAEKYYKEYLYLARVEGK